MIAALPRTPEAQFLAKHEKLEAKSAAKRKQAHAENAVDHPMKGLPALYSAMREAC